RCRRATRTAPSRPPSRQEAWARARFAEATCAERWCLACVPADAAGTTESSPIETAETVAAMTAVVERAATNRVNRLRIRAPPSAYLPAGDPLPPVCLPLGRIPRAASDSQPVSAVAEVGRLRRRRSGHSF